MTGKLPGICLPGAADEEKASYCGSTFEEIPPTEFFHDILHSCISISFHLLTSVFRALQFLLLLMAEQAGFVGPASVILGNFGSPCNALPMTHETIFLPFNLMWKLA